MYETVHCLQAEVLEHIPQTVQPFCLAEGMTFGKPQFSHGSWKGYLVGVVGDVAAEEDNVLWPNRVCITLTCDTMFAMSVVFCLSINVNMTHCQTIRCCEVGSSLAQQVRTVNVLRTLLLL